MIRVEVTLSFPLGATFMNNPKLLIYKQFIKMVRSLNCFDFKGNCQSCSRKSECAYFKISGKSFMEFPGILVRCSLFDKSIYRENEELKLSFYFIGDLEKYRGYVDIFFTQYLNQSIVGIPFCLKSMKSEFVSQGAYNTKCLRVVSPIECTDFVDSYNAMVSFYNFEYGTNYKLLCISSSNSLKQIVMIERLFKGKSKGYIGNVTFDQIVSIDKDLIELGVGKYNYLGGGLIEIKDIFK